MTTDSLQNLQTVLRELRDQYHRSIADDVRKSTKSYAAIAKAFGCSEQTVYHIARLYGVSRSRCEAARKSGAADHEEGSSPENAGGSDE